MLQARPLYDTEADARYFVEPRGWQRLLNAVEHRFNVAVIGPRGGGKTTALRQLQRRLRSDGVPVAFVDGTQARDVAELVDAIERELAGRPAALREPPTAGPPGGESLRLVERLRALASPPPAVVLVDCAHSASAANGLFGRLRDELWQLEHRWVVAVEDSERSILLAPPADAFFDQVVALELTGPDLCELLRRRSAALDEATLRQIAETAGSPRRALQGARDALTGAPHDDPLGAALWRRERAAALGRPHGMAMAELEALGGASASDEELLRRLGWTRARASQVLGELADAKLVEAFDERTAGGGRPRRVFRPAAPPAVVRQP
jgi:energy-coupling factor transporter ATP-binding protein EcfA2